MHKDNRYMRNELEKKSQLKYKIIILKYSRILLNLYANGSDNDSALSSLIKIEKEGRINRIECLQ